MSSYDMLAVRRKQLVLRTEYTNIVDSHTSTVSGDVSCYRSPTFRERHRTAFINITVHRAEGGTLFASAHTAKYVRAARSRRSSCVLCSASLIIFHLQYQQLLLRAVSFFSPNDPGSVACRDDVAMHLLTTDGCRSPGCAKGTFLMDMAREHPERNFLGLEIRRPVAAIALARARQLPTRNCHFVCGNANVSWCCCWCAARW